MKCIVAREQGSSFHLPFVIVIQFGTPPPLHSLWDVVLMVALLAMTAGHKRAAGDGDVSG